ncbi:MAG: LPD7 domain-containing protein, partial [Steroidobacteraceae bacterium]
AQARSARAVTVSGTDTFKREAWFAARLAGLDVLGYMPTALEQERLLRALARRRTAEKEDAAPGDPLSQQANGKVERQRRDAPSARRNPPQEGELIVGRLVDHGPAPYQHKPTQPMSYYVRIETDRGDREIWGVDLERAFRQSLSTPGVGDEVGLRAVGRDPVTVLAPKHDTVGREIGREELDTHRNQWLVERKDFLDRRFKMADLFRNAAVSASEAVKQYPELEGSYLQLQIARTGTEQRIPNREAREQFVDHLRAHLAKTIEYGQPLEPVHLKARSESAPEKVHDRDHAPTR